MASAFASVQKKLEREIGEPFDAADPIFQCGSSPLTFLPIRPYEVQRLAHEHIHSYPFNEVPEGWRRLYTDASLWRAVHLNSSEDELETKFVELLDMAVILAGAPLRQELIHDIFSLMALNEEPLSGGGDGSSANDSAQPQGTVEHQEKRRKISHESSLCSNIPTTFSMDPTCRVIIPSCPISRRADMDLTAFQAQVDSDHEKHNNNQGPLPFIITKAVTHWPALSDDQKAWKNPKYWMKSTLNGRRLVPIEIGRAYTDDDWSQKIVPFGKFMRDYLLSSNGLTGYLAQHDLFAQIPSLCNDILVPDFCYSTPPTPQGRLPSSDDLTEVKKNIWLGPAWTTSPLHTDPHHNVLTQVFGYKYVRLYSPLQTENLYPRSTEGQVDMSNTSRVDVGQWMSGDILEIEEEYPLFKQAEYVDGILAPGDGLFIPRGWWHYVESLSVSCSVSFWWD